MIERAFLNHLREAIPEFEKYTLPVQQRILGYFKIKVESLVVETIKFTFLSSQEFSIGHILIVEGEPAIKVYLLLEGSCKIFRNHVPIEK